MGGARPAAVSVPDLKGSSCMEVASGGEGEKRRTDRWSFTSVQSSALRTDTCQGSSQASQTQATLLF